VDPKWAKYPGLTPYHYTRNNPLNRIDPFGLDDGESGGNWSLSILWDKIVNAFDNFQFSTDWDAQKHLNAEQENRKSTNGSERANLGNNQIEFSDLFLLDRS